MERQTAGEDRRALPTHADFEILGRLRPRMRADVAGAVNAAQKKGALVAPGEAAAKIGVPRVAGRWLNRVDLDAHFEERPAEPGAQPLAEVGENLVLLPQKLPFTHDFAEGGAARRD